VIPLMVRGRLIGTLRICNKRPILPSEEQMEALRNLANNIAVAMDNASLYATSQRQSQEKSRLYELAGVISSSLEYHKVLERGLDGVMSLIPSPETAWVVVMSFDERADVIVYEASKGDKDVSLDGLRVPLDEMSRQMFLPIADGKVMMFQDITLLPEKARFPHDLNEVMKQIGIKSWLLIPLMVRGSLIGALRIGNRLPLLPSEDQIEALRNLANNMTIAMDNARLYETAQRQSLEKSRLYELAGAMSSSLEFSEVLDRALEGVRSLVPAPETAWTVISSYNEQANNFTTEASRGMPHIILMGFKFQVNEATMQWFIPVTEGKFVMVQDITLPSEQQRFPHIIPKVMGRIGMKSWLTIPLMVRGRLIGTLWISNKLQLLPNDMQLDALRNLANNIAVAMENASLYSQERQRAKELQSLEQLKTDFMLAISHELKTPLTSLSVSAGLLQEEVKTEPGTPINRLLIGMVHSVERLNRLVSDLLEAARLESAALELNWEFADIVSTVRSAATNFSMLMESKNQQFTMDVPPDGLWALVDLQRLEQIVANLLSNANKFTPVDGQIRLILKEEGNNFVLEVSDTGPGIPEDEQMRIFEPFYRARGMPRHTGSGLGLTIARRLTELHGGSIILRSQPGQGSTFIITIPKGEDKEEKIRSANS
jgi:signal transduction histidine kinase